MRTLCPFEHAPQPQIAVDTTFDDDGKVIFFPRSAIQAVHASRHSCVLCGQAVRFSDGSRELPFTAAVHSAVDRLERGMRGGIDRLLPR